MPALDRVLATVAYDDADRERLVRVLHPATVTFVSAGDRDTVAAALATADAAILRGHADERYAAAPALGWVHLDFGGADGSAAPALLARGIRLSTSAGRSSGPLADHALYFMLALAHGSARFERARRWRVWGVRGQHQLRALTGRTVLIVGTGHIGAALAHRCAALEMRVLGYRRRDQPVDAPFDEVRSAEAGDRLHDALAEADVVVLAASLNDASDRLIGAAEIAAMPEGSYLVNIARGDLVDEEALVAALRSGHLAGAGTDVAAREPLPPTSPLWRAPNLLITPHVTPRATDRTDRSLAIIEENARRYRAGEPLLNEIGPDDVLSRPPAWRGPTSRATRRWKRLVGRLP
jgi:phosphoglycerate dehydrogenase-like enzyme